MLDFECHYGSEIESQIEILSKIRQTVFREWPYLYEGNDQYEREYLQVYLEDPRSLCILVNAKGKTVGVSTLMPLAAEHADIKKPIADYGFDISKIFYFSETCLLPEYRGLGFYRKIFEIREQHVKSFGNDYNKICFCSVNRPNDHQLKPRDYRSLDSIWQKYGYSKVDGLNMSFLWKDVDQIEESRKKLSVWMKEI